MAYMVGNTFPVRCGVGRKNTANIFLRFSKVSSKSILIPLTTLAYHGLTCAATALSMVVTALKRHVRRYCLILRISLVFLFRFSRTNSMWLAVSLEKRCWIISCGKSAPAMRVVFRFASESFCNQFHQLFHLFQDE